MQQKHIMKITRRLSVLLNISHYRAWVADAIRTYRQHLRRGRIERALIWEKEIKARRESLASWGLNP